MNAILTCMMLFASCVNHAQEAADVDPLSANNRPETRYQIIAAINNTWGYDIYSDNRLIIHQPTIPGMPGNEGFNTKADAENVARLVIEKVNKGEIPPTVTEEELKKTKCYLI